MIYTPFILEGNKPFSQEDFLNKLFPNFWSFLINFLALIVLFVVLYFIAYKPVKKYLDARKNHIEKNIKDSETAKEIYERKASESEQIVNEARAKGASIIEKSQKDAQIAAKKIEDNAKEEASRIKRQADSDIAIAVSKAQSAMRDEIVNLAIDASKEVLSDSLDEASQKKILANFEKNIQKEGEK